MLKITPVLAIALLVLGPLADLATPLLANAQSQPATVANPAAPADAAGAASGAAATKAANVVKTTEFVDNPYGLEALWKGGDLVARITLGVLVIMSVGSWYIIVTKVYEQAK